MRLASFNVENLTDAPDSEAPLAARLEILVPQVERLEADIICFQEADATRETPDAPRTLGALERLRELTACRDFHVAATTHPATGHPRDRHNLVVFSRWPIRRFAQYANDLVPMPRYRRTTEAPAAEGDAPVEWDRPILHVEIALPGGQILHVVNMHLKSPQAAFVAGQKTGAFSWKTVPGWAEGYFLATVKQAGQALEARVLVDRLFDADPGALIAVAGDFNAEERDAPLRILKGDVEDTQNGRLAARMLVPLEHSLSESRRFTVIHRGRRMMLDHLLVSRPLLAHYREMEVHNEALGDELVAYTLVEAAPDSYHAPIVASFDMAET